MDADKIINRVAESGIITINLEAYLPEESDVVAFDLKSYLFMELILKEKEFRTSLKELDLTPFQKKTVAVYCSADAIIPMWAYMLTSATLQPAASRIIFGNTAQATSQILLENIRSIQTDEYRDKRVVIKGCGEKFIPAEAYLEITNCLLPVVKSLLFGEPCSTVPVFKRPS